MAATDEPRVNTRILSVKSIHPPSGLNDDLGAWFEAHKAESEDCKNIAKAAHSLRISDLPVAFPTETVYGLGADATRSPAVLGIYKAKRRPADNPLIVHVSSLEHLRRLLRKPSDAVSNGVSAHEDPIPAVYAPLISRFWPGPLTILLPNPAHSPLASEVTSGLPTFGCRIPSSPLARLLIAIADRPLAAPSANASTRPSPTTAQHVLDDLNGRIELILDGGPCKVGVESTVVDGLSDPPAILRPGGLGIEEIRSCGGPWSRVVKAYKDKAEHAADSGHVKSSAPAPGPRAPGMKYKHYSPRARVILFETGTTEQAARDIAITHYNQSTSASATKAPATPKIGTISTRTWSSNLNLDFPTESIALGAEAEHIARGLFSALRDLDEKGVETILIEGIDDSEGDLAAAVMNRLRKAAEVDVK
ncbi:putative translation initiation protein sua5 [Phaeomoniella chlamydospora]|uniref:Threonylcarbamoyl-AMP synthase n=1 Tax=Phaeomoniella chlamydospora TaxID=158046 RepID=A0A0G2EQ17_PHACM|nr:putative translation initiation protein sua5 [Phaeomoniella chlamydospora]